MSKEEILRKNNYLDEDGFIDINAIHKSMEEYATQCQEDMALQIQDLQTKIEDLTAENEQLKKTERHLAYQASVYLDEMNKLKEYINSLNKQD